MYRRKIFSGIGVAATVALAGCSGLTEEGDGGSISDSIEGAPDYLNAAVSKRMDASRGAKWRSPSRSGQRVPSWR